MAAMPSARTAQRCLRPEEFCVSGSTGDHIWRLRLLDPISWLFVFARARIIQARQSIERPRFRLRHLSGKSRSVLPVRLDLDRVS